MKETKLVLKAVFPDHFKSTDTLTGPLDTLCKRVKAAEAVFCSARSRENALSGKYLVLGYSEGHLKSCKYLNIHRSSLKYKEYFKMICKVLSGTFLLTNV